MSKYIDREKLAEFARHSTIGIDANDIMRFPTADVVEVKHGEWEYHSNPDCGIDPEDAFCSICGFHIDRTLVDNFDNYNFCPNCGADMKERKETE